MADQQHANACTGTRQKRHCEVLWHFFCPVSEGNAPMGVPPNLGCSSWKHSPYRTTPAPLLLPLPHISYLSRASPPTGTRCPPDITTPCLYQRCFAFVISADINKQRTQQSPTDLKELISQPNYLRLVPPL